MFKTFQDLKEQSGNAHWCVPVLLSLSRLCCCIQSPGFVGHGGDTDLKEGTQNHSLHSSATQPFQQPPPTAASPRSPTGHSFPLTVWPQEHWRDATGERVAVRALAPQKTLLLSPTSLPDLCGMKIQPLPAARG